MGSYGRSPSCQQLLGCRRLHLQVLRSRHGRSTTQSHPTRCRYAMDHPTSPQTPRVQRSHQRRQKNPEVLAKDTDSPKPSVVLDTLPGSDETPSNSDESDKLRKKPCEIVKNFEIQHLFKKIYQFSMLFLLRSLN